jgi:anaerobic selenocysteine-containing dehydrogenase
LADDYNRVREHIEHVVPGFTQYNMRVRQPGGFYLPNAPREGKFNTASKRAKFSVHPIPHHTLTDRQLMLTTIRSHDQFNTTIFGESDRYRGISGGRRVVFLNNEDMKRLQIKKDQWVDLISHFELETRRAERFKAVEYDIPLGVRHIKTNVLVPIRSVAAGSNQPVSKSIIITIGQTPAIANLRLPPCGIAGDVSKTASFSFERCRESDGADRKACYRAFAR